MDLALNNPKGLICHKTQTTNQAELRLQSLNLTARVIGLYVKADKTELMCFKQDKGIFTINEELLKLIN